jgi:hypothetical protein
MFDSNQDPLFPFYWTSNPRVIKGTFYERLSEFERETVAYMETLCIMNIGDLLHAESSFELLEAYLSKFVYLLHFSCLIQSFCVLIFSICCFSETMRSMTDEERTKFVLKARAKKAQPDDVQVNPLSQLLVEDEATRGKRKRKTEQGRISCPIPTKGADGETSHNGGMVVQSATKKPRMVSQKDKTSLSSEADKIIPSTKIEKEKGEQAASPPSPVSASIPTTPPPAASIAPAPVPSPWDPLFDPVITVVS